MKKTYLMALMPLMILAFFVNQSEADQILQPGSLWEYTFTDPTSNPAWNTTTGTGGWSSGLAPFGNTTGPYDGDTTGAFSYKTYWAADNTGSWDDDLWVRTSVDFSGYSLSSLLWNLGVDNGFKLYVNGTLVASANGEGYTYMWEYSGNFSGISLNPGINIIAVALEDHGGLTAFDMEIRGTAVPEPGILILLGISMVSVVGLKRWWKE